MGFEIENGVLKKYTEEPPRKEGGHSGRRDKHWERGVFLL